MSLFHNQGKTSHHIFLWSCKTAQQFCWKFRNLFIPCLTACCEDFFQLGIVKFCRPLAQWWFGGEYFSGGLRCSECWGYGLYRSHRFKMQLCSGKVFPLDHGEGKYIEWTWEGKSFSYQSRRTWKGIVVSRNMGNHTQKLLWNY